MSNIVEEFKTMAVKQKYLDGLGKESWVYKDLIIETQITTLYGYSGCGKTAIMYDLICPEAVKKGYDIIYFDLDSPPNDHKRMGKIAEDSGVIWINSNTTNMFDEDSIRQRLEELVGGSCTLSKVVLVFDTLKKFGDLMSKSDIKAFFKLLRKLTGKGATVVLLHHTNKKADTDGTRAFEGVGDVRSDTDALLFIEYEMNDVYQQIKIVSNPGENSYVKVRGIYDRLAFKLNRKTREVALDKTYLFTRDPEVVKKAKPERNHIINAAYDCIRNEEQGYLGKNELIAKIREMLPGAADNIVRAILEDTIVAKGAKPGASAYYVQGPKGKRSYYMAEND